LHEGLAALFGDASFSFDEDKPRKSSVEYYDSEGGNESLAAGMFDLSVVIDELTLDGPVAGSAGGGSAAALPTDEDPAAAAASMETAVAATTPAAASTPDAKKPMPRGVTLLSVDDNYRPRTSSNAKLPQPKGITLLSVDDNYRPRTSSRAKEPIPLSTSPPTQSISPLGDGQAK
jgi:hypothetical protein